MVCAVIRERYATLRRATTARDRNLMKREFDTFELRTKLHFAHIFKGMIPREEFDAILNEFLLAERRRRVRRGLFMFFD